MRSALLNFYDEARNRPYERNRLELLRSIYDGPLGRNRRIGNASYFCSELVAESYQRMGLLPERPLANEYTQAEFAEGWSLPLQLGAMMGPEILVCEKQEIA